MRFLEHTADTGVEVRARSLAECFARAAAGMFACFTRPLDRTAAGEVVEVEACADGIEELLVAWLDELLYQSEVRGLALHEFWVDEIAEHGVRGWARGPRFWSGAEVVGPGVKGVTRHGLEVRRIGDAWRARVIFDI